MPGKIFFKQIELCQQHDENQVHDDRNPRRFPAARARQIVLQLDEQVRYAGIIVQLAVGCLPSLGIVQAELLRLRLLGRSHRVLEWNLRDRHELSFCEPGLSVRH